MTRYLLDANVFIQAKKLHYGLDFCPAFWDWLVRQHQVGLVASIDKVADELRAGQDDLTTWAAERSDDFFLRPDEVVAQALPTVSNWVMGADYEPVAVSTFLQLADYWLIAHALAHDFVIVTHEVPSSSLKKIKIPDVCVGLQLRCVNPYEMLRLEQARFVLAP